MCINHPQWWEEIFRRFSQRKQEILCRRSIRSETDKVSVSVCQALDGDIRHITSCVESAVVVLLGVTLASSLD